MHTRRITKADFDQIVTVIDRWWGGPIHTFAHPLFFYELGHHAFIAEDEGRMIGFLLGFVAEHPVRTGYVHLVGIHPDFRRRGVGRLLYDAFTKECARLDCVKLKAISTVGNEHSLKFHEAVGWRVEEVADYAGPGRHRLVFARELTKAELAKPEKTPEPAEAV